MQKNLNISNAAQKLKAFYKSKMRPPSYQEIADIFGYKSKNAAYWLANKLINAGVLSRDVHGKLILSSVPGIKVLGSIQAGWPSPAEEELIDTMSLDDYMIKSPEQSYIVKVSGDSMVDAGLHPGDLVIVERGIQPKNGDIIIAQIDNEWTMKYYEKIGKITRLIPANKNYKPLQPKDELVIGGVVVGSFRKYK